jgi:hypothetical protein
MFNADPRNLSKKELRARITTCFAEADVATTDRATLLAEADVYISELRHRSDTRVSLRDLLLEVIIIGLIGWEIHMGYQQEHHQDEAFGAEKAIWKNMEKSLNTTADTLASEKTTMGTMSRTLNKELGLFYDVSVSLNYNGDKKRLTFVNMGRTNIVLWGSKLGDTRASIESEGRTVQPNGGYDIDFAVGYAIAL